MRLPAAALGLSLACGRVPAPPPAGGAGDWTFYDRFCVLSCAGGACRTARPGGGDCSNDELGQARALYAGAVIDCAGGRGSKGPPFRGDDGRCVEPCRGGAWELHRAVGDAACAQPASRPVDVVPVGLRARVLETQRRASVRVGDYWTPGELPWNDGLPGDYGR